MTHRGASAGTEEQVVEITRVFDAPRSLVFRAWTDPEQLAQWWGPHAFTNPLCELDARAGGAIRIQMCAPNGTIYPNNGVFHEIVEPERIVFTATLEDERGNVLVEDLNTVTFTEEGGKTILTLQSRIVKAADHAASIVEGFEQGWSESIDRLTNHLAVV